jgi:hypothetical protein
MNMKEVEATIADLSCNWIIGSETDPRYSRRTYKHERITGQKQKTAGEDKGPFYWTSGPNGSLNRRQAASIVEDQEHEVI